MSDIRGIHYEISKPVRNPYDGYYYQRIRQVDDQGNLVGIGEYVQRSSAPNSRDALVGPGLDLTKAGKTLGDAGRAALGLLWRNFQTAGAGATRSGFSARIDFNQKGLGRRSIKTDDP